MCTEDRAWVDKLLNTLFIGDTPENPIHICIKHMNRNHRQLYKYYDLESTFTLPNLEQYSNYYSNPTQFNDPFDCNIGLSINQIFQLIFPVVLQKLYPTWSKDMIDIVTTIVFGKYNIDASDEERIAESCREIPQFRELEESLKKGQLLEDYEIAQTLCNNPTIFTKMFMASKELSAKLSTDEANQLAEFSSDFLLKMREATCVNGVEDKAVLNKIFSFFDENLMPLERIIEAANLLGVNTDEDILESLKAKCIAGVAELHKVVGRTIGITCFCQRWNNVLMWSHYANKHTGICVEYDFDMPFETASYSLLLPVEYTKMRPLLPIEKLGTIQDGDFKINNTNIDMAFTEFLKALITKSDVWEYEQEWRHIVFVNDPSQRLVSLPIVSRIIMGVNISNENKNKMIEFASRHSIPLYQAQLVEDRYEMICKKIL